MTFLRSFITSFLHTLFHLHSLPAILKAERR
nr:MAG TPA: hypothetical protein [Caudoviricetes sp.]